MQEKIDDLILARFFLNKVLNKESNNNNNNNKRKKKKEKKQKEQKQRICVSFYSSHFHMTLIHFI